MKKIILLILVLTICVGGFYIIKYYNTNIKDTSKIAENSKETNNENVVEQDNNSNTNNDLNTDTSESNFKIVKIKENDFKNNYEEEKQFEIISKEYFNIEKENNNVIISLIESSQNKELLKDNEKVTYNKKYTISNVNAEDVDKIFCGGEGQDLMYPVVYLLLKDGTVKGVDIENGYNTGSFKAETISGLKDVQKIEQASVTPANDSGYEAVVAITKDETAYEIRKVD